MSDLKKQLIKLGSTNPELRPHIRKVLASLEFPEMQDAVDRLHREGVIDYPIEIRYFGPLGSGTVEIQLLKEKGEVVGNFWTAHHAYAYESPKKIKGISKDCMEAYQKVRRKYDADLWTVQWSFLNDKALWGRGLGKMAYEKILFEAGKFGAVVAPATCATGGNTSHMANRVWVSVSRNHNMVGPIVIPKNMRK